MRIAGCLAVALLLAGCSRGDAPVLAGTWSEHIPPFPGSGVEMTLLSDHAVVAGTGATLRDPGADLDFTVTGKVSTPAAGQLTFHYSDGTTEDFAYAQPDDDHLTLAGTGSTLQLAREK